MTDNVGIAASPKVAPETMVLRGSPAKVTRFRRGAVTALAALGSTAIIGIGWHALRPGAPVALDRSDRAPETVSRAPADALAGAPVSYSDVPVLGPPLPGDLGRPILLTRQRGTQALPAEHGDITPSDRVDRRATAIDALAAERRRARESALLVTLVGTPQAAPASSIDPADASRVLRVDLASGVAANRASSDNGRNLGSTAGASTSGSVSTHPLVDPVSSFMVTAGSIIPASLITGINSDLPGIVTAQVTEGVYDSVTGRTLLIPQGTRLIGRYDDGVAFGQRRALVVWSRLILPNGSSIQLDDVPASDGGGYAGLADRVDAHFGQLLKGVILSTLLGVGTEVSVGGDGELVRAVREATQRNTARAGDQLVAKNLGIQPTITVRPGWPLRVLVNKDLVLKPWSMSR